MMRKICFFILLALFSKNISAQNSSGNALEKSVRVNMYPSYLWGENIYPSVNSDTKINYKGGGLTTEFFNYTFLDYFSLSVLETDNQKFRMISFRNSFTYFIKDLFKVQYFAGFAVTPKGYFTYTIDSTVQIETSTGNIVSDENLNSTYKVVVMPDSLQSKADYFIHNGVFFKTNNQLVNFGIGGFFVFRPAMDISYWELKSTEYTDVDNIKKYFYYYDALPSKKTRPAMQSYQMNVSIEFFKNRKFSFHVVPGFITNSLFKEKFIYLESEFIYRPLRTTTVSLNTFFGGSRFMYSTVDGGYMIYNEDVLKNSVGIKLNQILSPKFELMAKVERMQFRLADTYSFYAGLKYLLKPF